MRQALLPSHHQRATVTGPRAGRPARRAPLRAVAFRDAHRTKQLADVGPEVVHGLCDQAHAQTLIPALEQLLDPSISVKSIASQSCKTYKGLNGDGIETWLGHHKEAAAKSKPEVLVSAGNDATDTAFCLIRRPGSGQDSKDLYSILELDIMLDDGSRRVTSIVERGQGYADANPLPFPHELLKPWDKQDTGRKAGSSGGTGGSDSVLVQRVEGVLTAWARAHCTGQDIQQCLQQAGYDDKLQVIDVNGTFGHGEERGKVLTMHETVDALKALQSAFDVELRKVDLAVSQDRAAAFMQWTATLKNKTNGAESTLEGIEVDILDPSTAGLRAVYLFRDPIDTEAIKCVVGQETM